jgi:hypothetical protein
MSCQLGDSFIAYISGGFDPARHVEKFLMDFFEIRETQGLAKLWIAAPFSEEDGRMIYGLETRKE